MERIHLLQPWLIDVLDIACVSGSFLTDSDHQSYCSAHLKRLASERLTKFDVFDVSLSRGLTTLHLSR